MYSIYNFGHCFTPQDLSHCSLGHCVLLKILCHCDPHAGPKALLGAGSPKDMFEVIEHSELPSDNHRKDWISLQTDSNCSIFLKKKTFLGGHHCFAAWFSPRLSCYHPGHPGHQAVKTLYRSLFREFVQRYATSNSSGVTICKIPFSQ